MRRTALALSRRTLSLAVKKRHPYDELRRRARKLEVQLRQRLPLGETGPVLGGNDRRAGREPSHPKSRHNADWWRQPSTTNACPLTMAMPVDSAKVLGVDRRATFA